MRTAFVILLIFASPIHAEGIWYLKDIQCQEPPSPPVCADQFSTYEDQDRYAFCGDLVKAYLELAQGYVACLQASVSNTADNIAATRNQWACHSRDTGHEQVLAQCDQP